MRDRDILFRCSSIGKLMGEPKKKGEVLSETAKTYVREMAAQSIFSVEFEVSSKQMTKGIDCEPEGIALFNRVYGRNLTKNAERRKDEFLIGESDLPDDENDEVVDIKLAWSLATFPLSRDDIADTQDRLYEYQLRAYCRLWNKSRGRIAYCMVDTPTPLIGYEPLQLHVVDGIIPENLRVTTWVIERDLEIEALMVEKVKAARAYYAQVIAEFDRTHQPPIFIGQRQELEAAQASAAAPVAAAIADAPDSAARMVENPGPEPEATPDRFPHCHVCNQEFSPFCAQKNCPDLASLNTEEQHQQQVLKAEPATADATDRGTAADHGQSVGSMGAGQPADAGPVVGPVPVERDEDGHFWHPHIDWNSVPEDASAEPYLQSLGFDTAYIGMDGDAPDEVVERYFEKGEPNCWEWTPSRPAGEGWFLAAIYDHEDGPHACWLRRTTITTNAQGSGSLPADAPAPYASNAPEPQGAPSGAEEPAAEAEVAAGSAFRDPLEAAVLTSPLQLMEELERLRHRFDALAAHALSAFSTKYPSHPKPPQSWFATLRSLASDPARRAP